MRKNSTRNWIIIALYFTQLVQNLHELLLRANSLFALISILFPPTNFPAHQRFPRYLLRQRRNGCCRVCRCRAGAQRWHRRRGG